MFHTADRPGIRFASPGALPIEVTHFIGSDLVNVKVTLGARRRVLATTGVHPELFSRKNLGVLNILDSNFSIFVTYTVIVVKIWHHDTGREETSNLPSL